MRYAKPLDLYLVVSCWNRKGKSHSHTDANTGGHDVIMGEAFIGAIVAAGSKKQATSCTKPKRPEFLAMMKITKWTCTLVVEKTKVECLGTPPKGTKPGVVIFFNPDGPTMRKLRKKYKAIGGCPIGKMEG